MLTCYSRYFMSGAAVALIVSNGWSMAAGATDEDDGPQTFREHCERLESAEHDPYRVKAVASILYDPAPVLADLRIDQFSKMRLEALVRAFLIHPHQARITRHIGGEDRGETADGSHQPVQPALRRPSSIWA